MSRLGVAVIALTLAAGPALAASVAARSGPAAPAAHAAPTTVTPQPAAPLPPQKTLHVGVEGAYPPFSEMTDDGKVKGFDIDFTNALCAEIRAKCLLVQDTFDHLQDDLVGGRVDMIVASLSMTDERRARYDFTNRYYQVPAKFVAKVGGTAPARFDNVALKGVKVGVEDGSVFANFATDRFGGIVDLVRYPTLPSALAGLGKGEVQLVLGDALALETDFLKTPDGKGFTFVGPDMLDAGWFGDGVGIAVRKDEASLRDQLNGGIAKLRSDGRYQQIASRYFGFDIYGPDVKPRPRVLVNMPAADAPWRHLQRPPGDDLGMHR